MDLKNKIILVTGSSRGIGKDICRTLAKEGAHIVATARNKELLEALKKEIKTFGGSATVIPADLSIESDVFNIFAEIKSKFGKLDVLVNNAGIGLFGRIVDFSMEDFDSVMRLNLRALFQCCREALKMMLPARKGYIINISSVVGIKGYPNHSAYTASKHGVMGLTKSLAAEVQEYGINVSVILPGGVDTDFIEAARPDLDKSILIPTSDISKIVLFMLGLSDKSVVDEIYIRRKTSKPF